MLEAETSYVAHEFNDYLILSITELRRWLGERRRKMESAEQGLQQQLESLPDRERLAMKCIMARDLYHLTKLYQRFLDGESGMTGGVRHQPEELVDEVAVPILHFNEWLFEMSDTQGQR